MAEDFLDSVFAPAEAEASPSPEIVAPVVEQASEPAPQPEAPQPAPIAEKEERHIPLATFLDTRDRAKAAERERDELRKQIETQAAPAPNPYGDPEAYGAHLQQEMQQQVTGLKFQMSDQMARQVHGAEVVDKAAEWATDRAKSDPAFAMSYMREPHPIDWIVREHKRSALLSEIGEADSLDKLFEREAAKRGYVLQSAPVPAAPTPVVVAPMQPAPRPAAPPRSIASDAPTSGRTVDDAASFAAIFKR